MLLDPFWLALLVKIAATVSVVVAASLAIERGGPYWGGLLCALPIGAGPGYVLLALQEDARFVAASALASLGATIAVNLFILVVVRLAPTRSLLVTLGGAVACWIAIVLLVRPIAWTAGPVLLANLATIGACCVLTRNSERDVPARRAARHWLDLPIRALLIGCVTAGIVTASRLLGPSLTGIALVFPIAVASLTAITHARLGGPAAAATMATALRAMPGFVLALVTLHWLVPIDVVFGFLAALASSLAWAGAMMAWRAYARPALSAAG
ncbi:MAG TPA: hypothetical protein VMB81_09980 [Candidatus Sulfotelmatobacter sp.]|nr:hypothetical protein [Candidatus Sulfotelmatobacter sp.]